MAQNEKNMRDKVAGGLVWAFGERMSAQLVSVLVTVVLARLLDPEHYGMISIVTVFISFLDTFVTSGFGSALVQQKESDDVDFDTAFLLSVSLSWVLYGLLFLFSPQIAAYYDMRELNAVLRVMGLRLPLAAINSIQHAYNQRMMNFKRFFWANSISSICSGIIGIAMASFGFGVWSLVSQYLSYSVTVTVMLFVLGEWKPKLRFSYHKAKNIWTFGWKVLVTQLVATLEGDIRSLVVGKHFGSADLAYYDQGKKYPALLVMNISATIDKVMLSAYSREQDNKDRILSMLRRSIRVGIFVLTPLLLGFAVVAELFVSLLLTDKWLFCVPFIQVFCLAFLSRPVESSCRQALLSIGKSGFVLCAMVIINAVALLCVIISVLVFNSVFLIALSSLLTTLVSLACFLGGARKYFGYKLRMQFQDSVPSLVVGVIMTMIVFVVGQLQINAGLLLILQIFIGGVVYIGCSAMFKLEPLMYLLNMIKSRWVQR